jgi:RNA polymerase sigma-70 factor (ECF subfamily)
MTKPFRRLAEEYRDRVYTFAYYSLNNREEAEDVTQDVLVKLWQNREKVDAAKLPAWVMRVTRNAVIDAARRRRTRASVIADAVEFELAESVVAARGPDTEQVVRTRELRDSLEEALTEVDEPYRSIVVMREIQDMTYAEIADTMETPLNTVKVYLHRGRKMLREALRGKV